MSYFGKSQDDKSQTDSPIIIPPSKEIIISPSKQHRLFNDKTSNNIPNEVVVCEHQTDEKLSDSEKSTNSISTNSNKESEYDLLVQRNNEFIELLLKDKRYGNIKLIEPNDSYFSNKKQQLIGLQYFLSLNDEVDQILKSEEELFETLMEFYKIHATKLLYHSQMDNTSLEEFKTNRFQKQMQHSFAQGNEDMLYILKKLHTRKIIQYLSESLQNDFDEMDENKNKSSDNKSNSVKITPTLDGNNPMLVTEVHKVTSDENKRSEYGIEYISNVEAKQQVYTLSNHSEKNATVLSQTNERRQQEFNQNQTIIENDMNQNALYHNNNIDQKKTKSLNKFIKPELSNNNDDGDNGTNNSGNHNQNHNGNHNGNNGGNPYDKTDRIYPNQMEDAYWWYTYQ